MDCPAGVMWADVLTNPLQGIEFRKMRAQLMNFAMEYKDEEESAAKKRKTLIGQTSQQDTIQTVQECVGRYPTIKLGSRKLVSKRIMRGIYTCYGHYKCPFYFCRMYEYVDVVKNVNIARTISYYKG